MSNEAAAAWKEWVEVGSRRAEEEAQEEAQERSRQHLRYRMLWAALAAIAKTGRCECGSPPFTDGKPCSQCFARQVLRAVEEAG